MSLSDLLQSRVLFVTGKGGTGKTTFSVALSHVGVALGKRVLVCELDNQRPSMESLLGAKGGFEPIQVSESLFYSNLLYDDALVDYLRRMVPSRRLIKLILSNQIIKRFLNFLPGAREIVTLSRLEWLASEYDLVVVDMPASGHAFSLLDVTRSALNLFRSGPIRDRAIELVTGLIQSKSTRLVFVSLPEEMVVNETIETKDRMEQAKLLGGEPFVFLNRSTPPSLEILERECLLNLSHLQLDESAKDYLRAGLWEDQMEQDTQRAQERLAHGFGHQPFNVRMINAQGDPRKIIKEIAVLFGRKVGKTRRDFKWI